MINYRLYVQILSDVFTTFQLTASGKNSVQIYEQTGLGEGYVSMIQGIIMEGKNYQEVIREVEEIVFGEELICTMYYDADWLEKAESSDSYQSEMEIAEWQGKILGIIKYRFRENVELVRVLIAAQTCSDHLKEWYLFAKEVCDFEEFIETIQDPYYNHPAAYYAEELEKCMEKLPKPISQKEYRDFPMPPDLL